MDALEELDKISFYVKQPGMKPIEVVLTKDLQLLTEASNEVFQGAVEETKFSAALLEYNLLCFFYHTDEGEIVTKEAAIAIAARCGNASEFTIQMTNYVNEVLYFLNDVAQVDLPDDE